MLLKRSLRKERGERIRARRLELGLGTRELARRVGASRVTIRNWESGRTDMTIDRLLDLCKALRVGVMEVVGHVG